MSRRANEMRSRLIGKADSGGVRDESVSCRTVAARMEISCLLQTSSAERRLACSESVKRRQLEEH